MNILCAGLWGGVNWFVKEVEELKRFEEAKKQESEKSLGKDKKQSGEVEILKDALELKKDH